MVRAWRSARTGGGSPAAVRTGRCGCGRSTPDRSCTLPGARTTVSKRGVQPGRTAAGQRQLDQTVRLWEVDSGQELRPSRGTRYGLSVAFSPDGRRLASGSYDQTVRLWEVDRDRSCDASRGTRSGVRSVAFSPDGDGWPAAATTNRAAMGGRHRDRSCDASRGTTDWVYQRGVQPGRTAARQRQLGPNGAALGGRHGTGAATLQGHENDV